MSNGKKTVEVVAGNIPDHHNRLIALARQALTYEASMAVGAAQEAVKRAQESWARELKPFVDKHADGARSIGPDHPNHAAFVEDAREVFERTVEIEIVPIPERLIHESARIMQERANAGVGQPLLLSYADLRILKEVGIIEGEGEGDPEEEDAESDDED
ncbi:MAG: hypothetical protein ACOCSF_05925 [Halanaeroarchaeum sp.]